MYFNGVNVLWLGKLKYQPGTHVQKHVHNFFQLIYVIDGKGRMFLGEEQHFLDRDRVFLCPPDTTHEYISDRVFPLRTIEIKFDIGLAGLFSAVKSLPGMVRVDTAEVRDILETSVEAGMSQKRLYRDTINANILLLLLKVLKMNGGAQEEPSGFMRMPVADRRYGDIDLNPLFDYVDRNLHASISLPELARLVGLTPSYLCRIFKTKYGTTPIQYINHLRLKKAKELLMHSELSITEIAEQVGFQSVHYFSRYFKEKEYLSPLEYKERARNSIVVDLADRHGYILRHANDTSAT